MKFVNIEKKSQGKFITRYDVTYETEIGTKKVYEMISREKDIVDEKGLKGKAANAVVIIATNEDGSKILLNKEYRMAVADWVYNFPAGLIEPGEDQYQAAKRELKEETGLELYDIEDNLYTSYSAVGFSNETNVVVIGKARGEFSKSTSAEEEIEANWYTKAEIRELLNKLDYEAVARAATSMLNR